MLIRFFVVGLPLVAVVVALLQINVEGSDTVVLHMVVGTTYYRNLHVGFSSFLPILVFQAGAAALQTLPDSALVHFLRDVYVAAFADGDLHDVAVVHGDLDGRAGVAKARAPLLLIVVVSTSTSASLTLLLIKRQESVTSQVISIQVISLVCTGT